MGIQADSERAPGPGRKRNFLFSKWVALGAAVPLVSGLALYFGSKKSSDYKMTGEELNAAVNNTNPAVLTTTEIEKREIQNKTTNAKQAVNTNNQIPAISNEIKITEMSNDSSTPTTNDVMTKADYATLQNTLKDFISAYNSGDHEKLRKMSSFLASLKFVDKYDATATSEQDAIWRTDYRDIFRGMNDKMRPEDFEELKGMLNDRFDDAVAYARRNNAIPESIKLSEVRIYGGPDNIIEALGNVAVDNKDQLWKKYDQGLVGVYDLIFEDANGNLCGSIMLAKTSNGKFVYIQHDFF